MGPSRRLLSLAVLLLIAGVPVLALAEPSAGELEENHRRLEKWRQDPEHWTQLRQNLAAFLTLPEERREQLRQLDRDWRAEDSATHARLGRVMERYADWLSRLPEEKRRQIEKAPGSRERLKLIKEIREEQWTDHLPPPVRKALIVKRDQVRKKKEQNQKSKEALAARPETERQALVKELQKHEEQIRRDEEELRKQEDEVRKRERDRRLDWRITLRHWHELSNKAPLPTRLSECPVDVQLFVKDFLRPMLSREDEARLQKAEGAWPLFPRTLVEVADKYPVRLPGPFRGPSRFDLLPQEVRAQLEPILDPASRQRLQQLEGRWPHYAIAVTDVARQKGIRLARELGPCTPKEFSAMGTRKLLGPKGMLTLTERARLNEAQGRWPDYPRVLGELGFRHQVPVHASWALYSLPDPLEQWDKYRTWTAADIKPLPEPPEQVLRDFAMVELNAEERAELNLSFSDPVARERLKQAYFKKHPTELLKLRQLDEKKLRARTKE